MAQIKLLTQGSLLHHEGRYTIGYAISNNDFELMENALISAVGILNNHPSTAANLSATALIKGFLDSFDAFKIWKNQQLKAIETRPIPSNVFLELPSSECSINLGTEIDNNKPSQMIYFELSDVKDIANSLRVAYNLVNDLNEFELITHVAALLEIFDSFANKYTSSK